MHIDDESTTPLKKHLSDLKWLVVFQLLMAASYLQSNSSYLMEMRHADEASKCFSCLTHNYNQTQIRIIL